MVDGALRLWAGEDFAASARREEGAVLAAFALRLADRMAEQVARRLASALPGESAPDRLVAIRLVQESLREVALRRRRR